MNRATARSVWSIQVSPDRSGAQPNPTSLLQPGRFAFGRSSANIVADSNSALTFGANGFTVEAWVKTDPVGRTYSIFGKEDFQGGCCSTPEWALRLFPPGTCALSLMTRALGYGLSTCLLQ
jgi:hypothetical protein